MSTTTLIDLQNQAIAKAIEVAARAVDKAQIASLQARMTMMDSPAYQQGLVSEAMLDQKHTAIQTLIRQCEQVVATTPIRDIKTRQDKKWNGRPTFGLGKDVELLHQLATGLQYSADTHKQIMHPLTGLNLNTVERFLASLGSAPYYNASLGHIIPTTPYDINAAVESATLLGAQLGMVLDTSLLTESHMANRFEKAFVKAQKDELDDSQLDASSHFTMS